jgi:hypothetical protein
MRLPLLLCLPLLLAGCAGAYYGAMEKIGIPKRQILVDRVEAARGAQQDAKQQFASALEQFLAVSKVPPTELQATYEKLNTELKRSESRAQEVRARLNAIDGVARALFEEWQVELTQYTNADLRRRSEQQLATTRDRYAALMRVMRQAESRMEPVLAAFRDQVLFLKHNLNAQAVAALDGTSRALRDDITRLIADMEKAIREADTFISTLQSAK